jgi:hypothetical protein
MLMHDKRLEGSLIVLNIHNSFQESLFENLKMELLGFLKNKLKRGDLTLRTEMVKNHEGQRPYTANEKMEYFRKKNPLFDEMVKELGLDPEF